MRTADPMVSESDSQPASRSREMTPQRLRISNMDSEMSESNPCSYSARVTFSRRFRPDLISKALRPIDIVVALRFGAVHGNRRASGSLRDGFPMYGGRRISMGPARKLLRRIQGAVFIQVQLLGKESEDKQRDAGRKTRGRIPCQFF